MNNIKQSIKAAFPPTIPILCGFLVLGFGFGLLMHDKGFPPYIAILMSAVVLAGSMQYVSLTLMTAAFNPVYAFLLTLLVNARHLFYGISMLSRYKGTGKIKPYLIFGLCDETFSIICSSDPPEGVERTRFYFFVTLFNHFYWVFGTAIGALAGQFIPFSTEGLGLDFALTALFIVIFLNQWKESKDHVPALIGVLCTAGCLLLLGPDRFLLPSMGLILFCLLFFKKPIERHSREEKEVTAE